MVYKVAPPSFRYSSKNLKTLLVTVFHVIFSRQPLYIYKDRQKNQSYLHAFIIRFLDANWFLSHTNSYKKTHSLDCVY